jgi:hypothetical protein
MAATVADRSVYGSCTVGLMTSTPRDAIEAAVRPDAAAETRYGAAQMAFLDSERTR